MAKPPLILVTASTEKRGVEFGDVSQSLSENYPRAVLAAGGLPLTLGTIHDAALVAEAVRRSDGVLLTGGDDLSPKLYADKLSPRLAKTVGPLDAPRDFLELLVIKEVFAQRKPLLAICRGHQLLNVALGGTLIVDIPSQVRGALNHVRLDKKSAVVHEAQLTPGSLLANITRVQRLGVNSSHHQSVDRVARALRVTAQSNDGVVEALELSVGVKNKLPWLLAVQFHPERLAKHHPEHHNIFTSFVRACALNAKSKKT